MGACDFSWSSGHSNALVNLAISRKCFLTYFHEALESLLFTDTEIEKYDGYHTDKTVRRQPTVPGQLT
jgi:hypothetical protein